MGLFRLTCLFPKLTLSPSFYMSTILCNNLLDNRHFLGLNNKESLKDLLGSTGDEELDERLLALANDTPGIDFPSLFASLLITAGRIGLETEDPHDLEMMNRTLKEMLDSELLFAPYKNFRKVSLFGSARIQPGEPSYELAKNFATALKDAGFMVITGAGPGIMEAGNEGAGAKHSFGLGINLPFETDANPYIRSSSRFYNYYYFFTRKLYFVKEADAFAAFPGGFGTMDEVFESLTLIQTGKTTIFPMVLMDAPGKTFWKHWDKFVRDEFIESGLISQVDTSLYFVTQDVNEAVEHIKQFYRVFHSYRFIDEWIALRLQRPLPKSYVKTLSEEFSDLLASGTMHESKALSAELDEPFLRSLPRLVFKHKIRDYARLRQLIDAINLAPESK